jgi:hypothetical protein
MARHFFLIAVLMLSLLGCSHYVTFQDPAIQTYDFVVPTGSSFFMSEPIKEQTFTVHAGVHVWHIPIGEAVHQYAASYFKEAFDGFEEVSTPVARQGVLITITELEYHMENWRASATIDFLVEDAEGKQVFSKSYTSRGPSAWGRVFAGGVFAMRSAIHSSTDFVLDEIFTAFVADLKAAHDDWE